MIRCTVIVLFGDGRWSRGHGAPGSCGGHLVYGWKRNDMRSRGKLDPGEAGPPVCLCGELLGAFSLTFSMVDSVFVLWIVCERARVVHGSRDKSICSSTFFFLPSNV